MAEIKCPDCNSSMHKHGKGWSGKNRRQHYQCSKCGKTRSLPIEKGTGK